MLYFITQGHERSIGLEILIRAMSKLPPAERRKFLLFAYKDSLLQNLLITGKKNLTNIVPNCYFVDKIEGNRNYDRLPESTTCLLSCLKQLLKQFKNKRSDQHLILLTLPTSKDQLIFKGEIQKGHTEFFRNYFKKPYLPMVFIGPQLNVLLITDHLPLKDVPNTIVTDKKIIISKVNITLEGFSKYFTPMEEVIFSGLNPHAGEDGLLGDEEKYIKKSIDKLKGLYPKVNFIGPVSADTMMFHRRSNKKQLFVYMYHDQGLSVFKNLHGVIGINVTFGLPFLRMSVDHGTAFELYGKNKADYQGALYMLKCALSI